MEGKPPIEEYGDDAIQELSDPESIRESPGQYVRGLGVLGVLHGLQEITDNIRDELASKPDTWGQIFVFIDQERSAVQFLVRDNARGVPLGSLRKVYGTKDAGGKFRSLLMRTASYKGATGGQFGVGATVTTSLSTIAKACSCRGTDGVAAFTMRMGHISADPTETYTRLGTAMSLDPTYTGTVVAWEPDASVLGDSTFAEFQQSGLNGLLTLLGKYLYFYPMNFTCWVLDRPLDIAMLKEPEDFHRAANDAMAEGTMIFDRSLFDPNEWLRQYWNVSDPFDWAVEVNSHHLPMDQLRSDLQFTVKVFASKAQLKSRLPKSCVLGMVNGIQLDDVKSDHVRCFHLELKAAIAARYADNRPMQDFILQESTVLPLYTAVGIDFDKAKFFSATKSGFRMPEFEGPYRSMLETMFKSEQLSPCIDDLHALLKDWIDAQYALSIGIKPAATNKLTDLRASLNFSEKFVDAIGPRDNAEMIFVEGASARPRCISDHEGTYLLRGKPPNFVIGTNTNAIRASILKNKIYQDAIRILGINPVNPSDLSKLRYRRAIIMTDGDAHGEHIGAIFLINMWVVCPQLVESGFFVVVQPPYYEISYKGSKFYTNGMDEFLQWGFTHVIAPHFDISVQYGNHTPVTLDEPALKGFLGNVLAYGKAMEQLSKIYNGLPIDLVELVYFSLPYLNKAHAHQIQTICSDVDVRYDPELQHLHIAAATNDYVVNCSDVSPLRTYPAAAASVLRPTITKTYITSKNTPHLKNRQIGLVELYVLAQNMINEFKFRTLKGVGSMTQEDLKRTCFDQRHRFARQIVGIGDAQATISTMNKQDPAARRVIL